MLPYIIGAGVGFLISEIMKSEKGGSGNSEKFYVFVQTEDFDKANMLFSDYETAKAMYDKIVKNKSIHYKDLVEYDEKEAKLYDDLKEQGETETKLSDKSKVYIVGIGKGSEEFESKEFN